MKQVTISNQDMLRHIIDELNLNHEVSFKVVGDSMLPFFKHLKTTVTLIKSDEYKKYDVILFNYEDKVVLHRIIKIKDDIYYMQGDGSFKIEKVKKNDIYGKVIDFKENEKHIKAYRLKLKIWLIFRPIRKYLLLFIKKV